MQDFDLKKTADGDQLVVHERGHDLLRHPMYNKGTGFNESERKTFELEGLMPAQYNDIDTQARRTYKTIMFNEDPVGRHISLAALQDRNEHLFYKMLGENLEALMPIVYTPTVGKAAQYFSRVFRRGRGIWITPDFRGRIEDVLRKAAPFSDVRLMVVTDNESILGIGDQGAGGMAISVGKLSLYVAGAGIHPARTLPISLDVGTDNQSLLDDRLYLGWRHKRLRGEQYDELVAEFVEAVRNVFPNALLQWEDLRKDNALQIMDRFRKTIPSFNDDIQGTGAVAAASLVAAGRITNVSLTESRILIYGAGAAGLGIARQLEDLLKSQGMQGDALRKAVLVMDSRGILSDARESLDTYKQELAWPERLVQGLEINDEQRNSLVDVVAAYKPTALIGASGQAGAFDEEIVKAMAAHVERPVILPMSNPTSISEGTPQEILQWTDGKALIATGSPFDDVVINGKTRPSGQANNVFVFPGLGLGAIVCQASEITDRMISIAASALVDSVTEEELANGLLMPVVERLWDVCGIVALAVAEQAISDGVAGIDENVNLQECIDEYRWTPNYPEYVAG